MAVTCLSYINFLSNQLNVEREGELTGAERRGRSNFRVVGALKVGDLGSYSTAQRHFFSLIFHKLKLQTEDRIAALGGSGRVKLKLADFV